MLGGAAPPPKMELVVVVVVGAAVVEEGEGRVTEADVPNAGEPPKGEETPLPPKMEDVVVAVVVVVVDAVAAVVEAGFAPPKDGALDVGAPPKMDPEGFGEEAPKTELDDVAGAAAVVDAPKMPLVEVPVAAAVGFVVGADAAGFEVALAPIVNPDDTEGVGTPKRDPVVLGAAVVAAGEADGVGVGKSAGLLMADSGCFWLVVNGAAENDDTLVDNVVDLGTLAVVGVFVKFELFDADAAVAASDPKLKDDLASVPKLKPELPPLEGFVVVDPRPNPEKEDCAAGGFGAAADEGGGFVAGVTDGANGKDPPDIDFGGVDIGVIVTLPRLKGLVTGGGRVELAGGGFVKAGAGLVEKDDGMGGSLGVITGGVAADADALVLSSNNFEDDGDDAAAVSSFKNLDCPGL